MVDDRSRRLTTQVKVEPLPDRTGAGLSVDAIDDWLENDLIQRGILGSTEQTSPVSQTMSDMISESSLPSSNGSTARRKRNKGVTKDMAIKRQRNTDAARRSRLRKALRLQSLEHEVSQLKAENENLAGQVSALEAKQLQFMSREKTLKHRIQELERQLRETRLKQGHIVHGV